MCDVCKNKHPWDRFLKIRMDVIKWMTEEMKKNNEEIAYSLSMDEKQVYLIKKHMEKEYV